MSYEGYDQILCQNGHLYTKNAYDDVDFNEWRCPDCGESCVWWNAVNETDGSFCDCGKGMYECGFAEYDPNDKCECCDENGRIDGYVELEVNKPAQYEVCNLGHKHITKRETYKIPTKKTKSP